MALRLKAALEPAVGGDRRRTSMAGSRRVTAQHGRRVTGRRVSAANLADRRGSIATMALHGALSGTGASGLCRRLWTYGSPPPAVLTLARHLCPRPCAAGAAADASPREAAGAGIRDRDFFPELPSLLSDVGGRLSRLLGLVGELEAAAAASAAGPPQVAVGSAASGEGSLDSSLAVTEASEAAVAAARTASARKLKWADGEGAPGVGGEAAQGGEGEGGESSGGDEEGGDAAAGERSLRKGFKRHTWAGPAWLDTVGTGKVRACLGRLIWLCAERVATLPAVTHTAHPPTPHPCSRSPPRCASSWVAAPPRRPPARCAAWWARWRRGRRTRAPQTPSTWPAATRTRAPRRAAAWWTGALPAGGRGCGLWRGWLVEVEPTNERWHACLVCLQSLPPSLIAVCCRCLLTPPCLPAGSTSSTARRSCCGRAPRPLPPRWTRGSMPVRERRPS